MQAEINKLKKGNQKSGKGSSTKKSSKPKKEKPAWFNSHPKENELKNQRSGMAGHGTTATPDIGGKCDGKHRLHRPTECKGKAYQFKGASSKDDNQSAKVDKKHRGESSKENKKRAMRLKKSLEAATTNITEESYSENESDEA